MKNYIKILLIGVGASVALSGCIKETFPMNNTATSDQVGGSESGLQAMVLSLNAQMTTFNTLGFAANSEQHWDFGYPSLFMQRDLMCEDMATIPSTYHQFRFFETNLNMSGEYASSRFWWTFYYRLVYLANSILAISPEGEYAGIARTYRALAYLDMVRMYDFKANNYTAGKPDLAVPIVTETTTEDQAANNPRAATKDVYAMIETDLLAAETDLANYRRSALNTPDVTVVWGLLAKMYLEMGARFGNNTEYYGKAAAYARKAIDKGGYKMLTEAQWLDKTTGFNSSTSQSSWMWSINITKEDRVVTTAIINFTSMISPECTFGYGQASGKESPQKCIDRRFYEAIPASDWRKKAWLAPDYSNASSSLGGAEWANEKLAPYVQFKFRPGQGNMTDNKIACAVDLPVMRIEEMYLIEAEAKGLAGGDGKSLLESFAQTRNPNYVYDGSKSLSENVLLEKRIEFWGEGIVIFDYKRLNKGITRGYAGTNHFDATRFNTTGIPPWFNFCININELNSNSGITAADNNPDPTSKVPLWEE